MVLLIVLGMIALAVLIMGLALRALYVRRAPLLKQQAKLQVTLARAQQTAEVAQALQAHADSLKLRGEFIQEQLTDIKERARSLKRAR